MYGSSGLPKFNQKKWVIRNPKIEKLIDSGELKQTSGQISFRGDGLVIYFTMTAVPSNCGALIVSGQDSYTYKPGAVAVIDFLARNYASLTGHNVLMMSGDRASLLPFTRLRAGWKTAIATKSSRKKYQKDMLYLACEIPKEKMGMIGYGRAYD